jgi:uncharacterized damage-inducible protein DinB
MKAFENQYGLVKDCRNVLFKYCKSISQDDFTKSVKTFGRGGSIRNLLTHIANTYQFWIGQNILKKNMTFPNYESIKNISDAISLFDNVNHNMEEFFSKFAELKGLKINYEINGVPGESDPFPIFTHVITHEFHHKGQILSLSRKLGYIPIDADIMR